MKMAEGIAEEKAAQKLERRYQQLASTWHNNIFDKLDRYLKDRLRPLKRTRGLQPSILVRTLSQFTTTSMLLGGQPC
jgi:hypothetical protein